MTSKKAGKNLWKPIAGGHLNKNKMSLGATIVKAGGFLRYEMVMDVHHLFEVFKPLLIAYAIMIPVVGINRFLLNRKQTETYTMTDRRGYKMVVTLDFKMGQDERYAALKELGLRPLEYKTKHLPPGVFKVEVLNAHEYDNA